MKFDITIVSAGQIKRLINTNKKCVLVVVREKYVETSDAFQGCDPSHKDEVIDVISNYDEIFRDPSGFPLKREIQHGIHLQQDVPLPNVDMYRMSTVEMVEIKK
jgi:hypothetical protein